MDTAGSRASFQNPSRCPPMARTLQIDSALWLSYRASRLRERWRTGQAHQAGTSWATPKRARWPPSACAGSRSWKLRTSRRWSSGRAHTRMPGRSCGRPPPPLAAAGPDTTSCVVTMGMIIRPRRSWEPRTRRRRSHDHTTARTAGKLPELTSSCTGHVTQPCRRPVRPVSLAPARDAFRCSERTTEVPARHGFPTSAPRERSHAPRV